MADGSLAPQAIVCHNAGRTWWYGGDPSLSLPPGSYELSALLPFDRWVKSGKENVTLEPRWIRLEKPINELGVYEISLQLHADIEATTKLWVVESEEG